MAPGGQKEDHHDPVDDTEAQTGGGGLVALEEGGNRADGRDGGHDQVEEEPRRFGQIDRVARGVGQIGAKSKLRRTQFKDALTALDVHDTEEHQREHSHTQGRSENAAGK